MVEMEQRHLVLGVPDFDVDAVVAYENGVGRLDRMEEPVDKDRKEYLG